MGQYNYQKERTRDRERERQRVQWDLVTWVYVRPPRVGPINLVSIVVSMTGVCPQPLSPYVLRILFLLVRQPFSQAFDVSSLVWYCQRCPFRAPMNTYGMKNLNSRRQIESLEIIGKKEEDILALHIPGRQSDWQWIVVSTLNTHLYRICLRVVPFPLSSFWCHECLLTFSIRQLNRFFVTKMIHLSMTSIACSCYGLALKMFSQASYRYDATARFDGMNWV